MNFFFDNCISPKLASTIDGYVRNPNSQAVDLRFCAAAGLSLPASATEVEWIEALGVEPREWIVITGDARIRKVAAEREAFRRARLKGFLLPPSY
ncbi:MAG: hypothetical protein RIB84_20845 [Sneathiellaceae bacterium]